jgi:uncharacterized membrane protein
MSEIDARIGQLQARLDNLVKYQEYFNREINQIRNEINYLRAGQQKQGVPPPPQPQKPPVREPVAASQALPAAQHLTQAGPISQPVKQGFAESSIYSVPDGQSDLEKFVGQNLLSIIGIIILVVGIGIGGKYAIDNNWITPTMRIVIGYIVAFGLVGFALYLKQKYHNFSAVLMSGAMAIMYFITYFAYSLYDLYSQTTAFALMLVFTAVTVFWALNYGKQVIAHIGLVGAYAIPFMLGGNSGNYTFLFSYIAIINFGILLISIRRYWKWLFYNAFGFTWFIYFAWYAAKFQPALHFELALTFLTIFFLMFYLTFLIHKLIFEENFAAENVGLILANSFIFYGFGYGILKQHGGYENYLGLFTVLNAAIHFAFALVVSRMRKVPRDISYLLAALVLIFITIAVPVQFKGNWLTLVWIMEAVLLFWLGRTKQIALYEYFSYPVMLFASLSLFSDWQKANFITNEILAAQYPFLNGVFITTFLYAVAFGFIFYINRDEKYQPAINEDVRRVLGYAAAAVAIVALYNAFRTEIDTYFNYLMFKTAVADPTLPGPGALKEDKNLRLFNIIWQMNYTMFFLTVLGWLNIKRFKDPVLAIANLSINALLLTIFLSAGLFFFGQLHEEYLFQIDAEFFPRGVFHILIRYISYAFLAAMFFVSYRYTKQEFVTKYDNFGYLKPTCDFGFYISIWLILSSELINWMAMGGYQDSYKLGLSILWGIYALFLIILGIYYRRKDLRIGAIALFGVTLIKLFFYDIVDQDTISKVIIFVSLGILLLIISFLYNKYKALIFDPDEDDEEPDRKTEGSVGS